MAGALTKTVENALRQRTVVAIKVMTAGGADDLCLSLQEPARGIVLVSAIEALKSWSDRSARAPARLATPPG